LALERILGWPALAECGVAVLSYITARYKRYGQMLSLNNQIRTLSAIFPVKTIGFSLEAQQKTMA